MSAMPEASASSQRFLAPAQVAELLSLEVGDVIALVKEGQLRGMQVGSPARWRIDESSLGEYIAAQSELSRRMALWQQSEVASFPEVWGSVSRFGN